ncbi:MAG: formate dehydrogenase accessory sulfurtransferase FdhD [Acidobacteriota bacterium]
MTQEPPGRSKRFPVRRDGAARELDDVVVEEALEIRLASRPLAVTMRTPGDDVELALGFLHSERVVETASEIVSCTQTGSQVVEVELATAALDRWARRGVEREFRITAACGACGRPSLEDVERDVPRVRPWRPSLDLVRRLPGSLREEQRVFTRTGGCHAAALFGRRGELVCSYEDVGRHNAVDKVVGRLLQDGALPAVETILVVSGRAGFELVEKAALAGIPAMASVGATTSAAVDVAQKAGLELFCFVSEQSAVRFDLQ